MCVCVPTCVCMHVFVCACVCVQVEQPSCGCVPWPRVMEAEGWQRVPHHPLGSALAPWGWGHSPGAVPSRNPTSSENSSWPLQAPQAAGSPTCWTIHSVPTAAGCSSQHTAQEGKLGPDPRPADLGKPQPRCVILWTPLWAKAQWFLFLEPALSQESSETGVRREQKLLKATETGTGGQCTQYPQKKAQIPQPGPLDCPTLAPRGSLFPSKLTMTVYS